MRKTVLLFVTVMALSATAWSLSQDALVDMYTRRLTTELELSDQQTQEVHAILNTEIGKLRTVALNKDTRPRDRMQEIRGLTQTTSTEIAEKLDDQQKQKLTNLAMPLLPDVRLLQLDDRLDLSSTQVSQIEDILAANRSQRMQPRERGSLNRDDFRKQMQENMEKTDAAIEKVLTDQQKQTYEKMKQEQRDQMQQRRGERRRH